MPAQKINKSSLAIYTFIQLFQLKIMVPACHVKYDKQIKKMKQNMQKTVNTLPVGPVNFVQEYISALRLQGIAKREH